MIFMFAACEPEPTSNPDIIARLPQKVDYNYHIKPILSDRCYACHGPDENKREADLRLDTQEGAFAALGDEKDRYAIKAGSLSNSEIYHRISSEDPDELMPPPDSKLSLTPYELALINKWISQGAEWKPHWSFIPLQAVEVPKVKNANWVRNPIDHFILSRLEGEGIQPSPEASKERLIRRLSFDLTGLPPTIAEIDAFLADDSPDAYEKVVDRLLASPHYGERMANEWMDVARYADSHGLHADGWRNMWPWRDWVISAFNENMPFDRFVTWQLAGDMLPNPTKEQKLATAFHRNHPMTAEGGVVGEEWRLEYVFDRTTTTARAFMGLTVECARCHDHKFDPISQKEFFQLSAFFNNVKELGMTGDDGNYGPCISLPDEKTEQQLLAIEKSIRQAERKLATTEKEIEASKKYLQQLPTEKGQRPTGRISYFPLNRISKGSSQSMADGNPQAIISGQPELIEGKKGKALRFDNDYDLLHLEGVGNFEKYEAFSAGLWLKTEKVGEIQTILSTAGDKNNFWRGWEMYMDSLNHPAVRLISNLAHDYIHIISNKRIPVNTWTHLLFTYDGSGKAKGLKLYLNGKAISSTVEYDRLRRSIKTISSGAHNPTDRPVRIGKSYRGFTGENGVFLGSVDDIQLFDWQLSGREVAWIAGLEANSTIPKNPDDDQKSLMLDHFLLRNSPDIDKQKQHLQSLYKEQLALIDSVPEIMVMEEMSEPRATFVLDRGLYDAPMYKVGPEAPEKLGGFPQQYPKNRLGLAQWLLSPDHPLTARVIVNRYWQMYFGKGLVATPEDFGSQGALPTHPALLDWLAIHFMRAGWDIKAFQKMIVMSACYRQSSRFREDLNEIDPENELLAKGPSYRLPAEMIRDHALASSGLLIRKIGGPSVKPYQPPGLWIDKGNFSHVLLHYKEDEGEGLYRRSLYTFIRRTSPPPSMMAFDASDRNACIVRRQSTNTPMQALILMNDPQYVEASRLMAERIQKEGGDDLKAWIEYGFRLATSRKPSKEEIEIFTHMYEDEVARLKADPQKANELLGVGEKARDESLDVIQTASLAIVSSMMLNHDESYMKR